MGGGQSPPSSLIPQGAFRPPYPTKSKSPEVFVSAVCLDNTAGEVITLGELQREDKSSLFFFFYKWVEWDWGESSVAEGSTRGHECGYKDLRGGELQGGL